MISQETVVAAIDALNALRVPYMLAGSFSSNFYGIPRSTQDADFVIQLGGVSIANLAREFGPNLKLDPQMSFETITGTSRYVATTADRLFKIELFLLSDDPHDIERFRRRRPLKLFGRDVVLPTAEDVIVTKLRWSQRGRRTKDIEDIKSVLAVQSAQLDWPYIENWCDQHGTRELLEEFRRAIPPAEA